MSLTTPERVENALTLLKSLSIPDLLSASRSENPNSMRPKNADTPAITNDAISFLDQVKIQFADQPWVYNNFLDITKDYADPKYSPHSPEILIVRLIKTCRKEIFVDEVLDRVYELFADHPYLLEGFDSFLPPGHGKKDNPDHDLTKRQRKPSPLTITLRGLHTTATDPTKATVLYTPPVLFPGLKTFCNSLRAPFLEAGLMIPDTRPLLLHATIVNTIYVKNKAAGASRGDKGGYARKQGKVTIDATELLDEYEDFTWVEDMRVERVAICKMGAKKVEDESVGQEYEQEAWVEIL